VSSIYVNGQAWSPGTKMSNSFFGAYPFVKTKIDRLISNRYDHWPILRISWNKLLQAWYSRYLRGCVLKMPLNPNHPSVHAYIVKYISLAETRHFCDISQSVILSHNLHSFLSMRIQTLYNVYILRDGAATARTSANPFVPLLIDRLRHRSTVVRTTDRPNSATRSMDSANQSITYNIYTEKPFTVLYNKVCKCPFKQNTRCTKNHQQLGSHIHCYNK